MNGEAKDLDWKCELLIRQSEGDAINFSVRSGSMAVSLLCVSFSFVSHHRTLRISLPDKQNLNVLECNLMVSFPSPFNQLFLHLFQLAWRFLTIFGRFVFLSLLIYFHFYAAVILFFLHLVISTIHVSIFQRIQIGTKFDFLDKLMILINVWVHIFAPFNMSDGRTRLRYLIGYGIEVIEMTVGSIFKGLSRLLCFRLSFT